MSDFAHQEERSRVVALLAVIFPAVQRKTDIEGWRDDWHNCVYLLTPRGQLSWHYHDSHEHLFEHVPQAPDDFEYDGHTTDTKYQHIVDLIDAYSAWDVHPQGTYAMQKFCERLLRDGFIARSREAEFRERVENHRRGLGFLTAEGVAGVGLRAPDQDTTDDEAFIEDFLT